jgi:hypothetical protein
MTVSTMHRYKLLLKPQPRPKQQVWAAASVGISAEISAEVLVVKSPEAQWKCQLVKPAKRKLEEVKNLLSSLRLQALVHHPHLSLPAIEIKRQGKKEQQSATKVLMAERFISRQSVTNGQPALANGHITAWPAQKWEQIGLQI